MADADAFVLVGTCRRGHRASPAPLLICMGLASVVLFCAGMVPAYMLERSGYIRDASERCPESIPSEQGYDGECVQNLLDHGPIYLGKEPLAMSFLLGTVALVGAFRMVGVL